MAVLAILFLSLFPYAAAPSLAAPGPIAPWQIGLPSAPLLGGWAGAPLAAAQAGLFGALLAGMAQQNGGHFLQNSLQVNETGRNGPNIANIADISKKRVGSICTVRLTRRLFLQKTAKAAALVGLSAIPGCVTLEDAWAGVADALLIRGDDAKNEFTRTLISVLKARHVNVILVKTLDEWKRICREHTVSIATAFYSPENHTMYIYSQFLEVASMAHEGAHALQREFGDRLLNVKEIIFRQIYETHDDELIKGVVEYFNYLTIDYANPMKEIWSDHKTGRIDHKTAVNRLKKCFWGNKKEFDAVIKKFLGVDEKEADGFIYLIYSQASFSSDELLAQIYLAAVDSYIPLEANPVKVAVLLRDFPAYPAYFRVRAREAARWLFVNIQAYPKIKEMLCYHFWMNLGLPLVPALTKEMKYTSPSITVNPAFVRVAAHYDGLVYVRGNPFTREGATAELGCFGVKVNLDRQVNIEITDYMTAARTFSHEPYDRFLQGRSSRTICVGENRYRFFVTYKPSREGSGMMAVFMPEDKFEELLGEPSYETAPWLSDKSSDAAKKIPNRDIGDFPQRDTPAASNSNHTNQMHCPQQPQGGSSASPCFAFICLGMGGGAGILAAILLIYFIFIQKPEKTRSVLIVLVVAALVILGSFHDSAPGLAQAGLFGALLAGMVDGGGPQKKGKVFLDGEEASEEQARARIKEISAGGIKFNVKMGGDNIDFGSISATEGGHSKIKSPPSQDKEAFQGFINTRDQLTFLPLGPAASYMLSDEDIQLKFRDQCIKIARFLLQYGLPGHFMLYQMKEFFEDVKWFAILPQSIRDLAEQPLLSEGYSPINRITESLESDDAASGGSSE